MGGDKCGRCPAELTFAVCSIVCVCAVLWNKQQLSGTHLVHGGAGILQPGAQRPAGPAASPVALVCHRHSRNESAQVLEEPELSTRLKWKLLLRHQMPQMAVQHVRHCDGMKTVVGGQKHAACIHACTTSRTATQCGVFIAKACLHTCVLRTPSFALPRQTFSQLPMTWLPIVT